MTALKQGVKTRDDGGIARRRKEYSAGDLGNGLRNEGQGWLLRLGRAFGQLYDGAVGDFPTETFHLLLMMEMFFEEYGLAGVRGQRAGYGHKDFAGSVVNLDPTSQQSRVTRHGLSLQDGKCCFNGT
jgi:hypothetical protein